MTLHVLLGIIPVFKNGNTHSMHGSHYKVALLPSPKCTVVYMHAFPPGDCVTAVTVACCVLYCSSDALGGCGGWVGGWVGVM